MPNDSAAPCRLTVLLARDAPLGVVLRRGPSAWSRLSLWHTDTDRFEHGQWLRGRVYERRCDLSPDGALFAYFVRKTKATAPADSWLAISRPPYFTALALWFVGGTYATGGYFVDARTLWQGYGPAAPDLGTLPPTVTLHQGPPALIDRSQEWTERTVFGNRLLRDGWTPVGAGRTATWEHRHPAAGLTLVMLDRRAGLQSGGGSYHTEYAVRVEPDRELYPLGIATWADWDRRGRLIVAQQGRLLRWSAPDTLTEIADFNAQRPERIEAPPEALEWP